MEGTRQTIELDCPPGGTRPWDLIEGVVKDTPLTLTEADLAEGAMFGHREWVFTMPQEQWESQVQPVIKPRIQALYNAGVIRYGSW
jgi:hypothetical protein